jgi:succinoglycan biosynthesis protein ExoM
MLAVLVPTYRRPKLLLNTLDSIARQAGFERIHLVVSDNDADAAEGQSAAREHAERFGYSERLTTLVVPKPGLSENRNAGLAAAFSVSDVSCVAMIDDDATANEGWVLAIECAIADNPADIYGGPTYYTPDGPAPEWFNSIELFTVPYSASGYVPRLRSSNNCVITRGLWLALDEHPFDRGFSQSGGEDTQLFAHVRESGGRAYWIADAGVHEPVPAERVKLDWIVKRHQGSASNSARIDVGRHGAFAIARQIALASKEYAAGLVRILSRKEQVRFTGKLRRAGALGRLYGTMGGQTRHDGHGRSA